MFIKKRYKKKIYKSYFLLNINNVFAYILFIDSLFHLKDQHTNICGIDITKINFFLDRFKEQG